MMTGTRTIKSCDRTLLPLAAACVGALVAFGGACSDEEEDFMGNKQKEGRGDGDGTGGDEDKAKATDLSYTYNALNRRDPFKTYFDELSTIDPQDQNLTELQKVELDKLTLVAVVVGTATPMAMVEDPSGRGHTVKIGTLIGKRLGQVKHIRRGEIIVQEEFRDFTGKRIPQLKELKLEEERRR